MFKQPNKANCQLVARCFFIHGKVELNNYNKYYKKQEEQHIIDQIEMGADY